ncbi:hypothetical protein BCY91_02120 [Pelobium manganitolerans]|uniref:Sugar 3,4-ketoisomerase QdtA cupin domain-containing protein n=1 Tax=Pelobium manganitolerans TaxID=1842495 RepID=A0A419SC87_9SPHI|nr:WxcM-like domain-containing protein [Pelobium manganitolerans]RKD20434.1 hypothetical protein BCY91_02120 [Pelobium manganitolerans]
MLNRPKVINGGSHTDVRGTLGFVNDFDMAEVKRFYKISHPDTTVVRAWRAHKIEQRWFHATQGAFEIKLVEIDNWDNPNPHLKQHHFDLSAKENTVLHVPKGYASSLRALEPNSTLLIFADSKIDEVVKDDYLFATDYFIELK